MKSDTIGIFFALCFSPVKNVKNPICIIYIYKILKPRLKIELRTDEFVRELRTERINGTLLKRRQGSQEDLNFLENPRSASSKKREREKRKERKKKKRSHLNRCIVSDGPAIYTLWMVFQWFSSVQYLLKTLDALSRCSSSLPPTTFLSRWGYSWP